ncbi:hypothetical protein [Bartonella sp. CL45QHWL]|uniref:hypothetical protein n=1 Tax=Bartonella sp. CL45QHWL TaxID=3243533 RepID=UPI0035CF3CCE
MVTRVLHSFVSDVSDAATMELEVRVEKHDNKKQDQTISCRFVIEIDFHSAILS